MKERVGLSILRRLERPVVLAIGVFDGIHRGHQKVIERCVEEAKQIIGVSAVLTFHPHPAKVVRPESAPRLLTTEEQDRQEFARLGVELCITVGFDQELREMSGADFLKMLLRSCPTLRAVVVGHEWHFGRGRDGNFEMLKKFCEQRNLTAIEVAPVRDEASGEVISSTRIRNLVSRGDLAEARRLLGRPFSIQARVVPGAGRGKALGFPTVNLETDNEMVPPVGVYAVAVEAGGRSYAGAMNIGHRPTFGDDHGAAPVLEVHLLEFKGALPPGEIEVEFLRRLRDEKKFSGPEELKAQIAKDVAAVRQGG